MSRRLHVVSPALASRVALLLAVASSAVMSADAVAQVPGCDRSLQSLVDAGTPGGTVVVPPCVYRESIIINKPLMLVGQLGSEIRGSDVWSSWTPIGGVWVSQQSAPTLPAVSLDPNACDPGGNGCLQAEQVFIDGIALSAVPPGSAPEPGQFAVDGFRIVLADNPTGHIVEVTTRARWIVTAADGVTVQSLTMRHAGNSALAGAISNDGHSDWTLQDSSVSDAHAANISLDGGADVRVLHNSVGRAGLVGIAASGISRGGVVQNNRLHGNRTADVAFNRAWGAGGLKLTEVQGFQVDGNEVDHNDGVGLWCDIGCSNVTFSNNRVHHNQWQGINFEISDGASIYNNDLWENGWGFQAWGWGAGIVASSSANAEIFNNTVAWNYAGISVIWQNRPDSPGPNPVGNYVHDNTIVKKTVVGDFNQTFWNNLSLAWLSDGSAPLYSPGYRNRAEANAVWYDQPESQTVRFAWSTQYLNLRTFADSVGGSGTHYLSTTALNQILTDRNIPLIPEN